MSAFNCGLCGRGLTQEGRYLTCRRGYCWPEKTDATIYPPWLVGLQWFLGALLVFKLAQAFFA